VQFSGFLVDSHLGFKMPILTRVHFCMF